MAERRKPCGKSTCARTFHAPRSFARNVRHKPSPTPTTLVREYPLAFHSAVTDSFFFHTAVPFVLSDRPVPSQTFPSGHYLVPDTNALLNGLDLFEQTTAFYDVIILQTVLEELRNRSLPLYNRVLALTRSEEKRFYVFFNDFRLETHVLREAGETINDRNDRAVRRAVQWYGEHLAQNINKERRCPAIVMLSDDRENLQKTRSMDLQAMSCW